MNGAKEWLEDPSTFVTCVMAIIYDHMGDFEWLEWDPITIQLELEDAFGVVTTPELMDKVNCGASIFNSNVSQLSLEAFGHICNVLNLGVTTSQVFLPPDLDDVAWGVLEMKLLLGKELFEETPFSHNIARYVGFLLAQEGVTDPPDILSFAEYPKGFKDNTAANLDETDELIFQTFWESQQSKKGELDRVLNAKYSALIEQLKEIPLKNKNTDFIEAVGLKGDT